MDFTVQGLAGFIDAGKAKIAQTAKLGTAQEMIRDGSADALAYARKELRWSDAEEAYQESLYEVLRTFDPRTNYTEALFMGIVERQCKIIRRRRKARGGGLPIYTQARRVRMVVPDVEDWDYSQANVDKVVSMKGIR
jgi:DNA-directed RNA polymerase specialized sigma24 family protein